jgi:hypothetical protein
VYNGSIADSPVLHDLFQDYNIIKYIGLIITLGKSIIDFRYYSYWSLDNEDGTATGYGLDD